MNLLILGGTIFLGKHLVEQALERGHRVTLFNRGQHNAGLFPAVEKLRGNRDGDTAALEGRSWDAVIDTCGYLPRVVGASARLLAESVEHYTFISSISVYRDFNRAGIREDYPLGTLEDESVERIDGETYGPLKALCERAAEQAMPGRVLNIRPGLIVGPDDPTDRFTYWPHRMAQGGMVLAPGRPERPVKFIDVRDLAGWIIRAVEQRRTGPYNATGPDYTLSMGRFLEECRQVCGPEAQLEWVEEDFLVSKGVEPWSGIPLWVLEAGEMAGIHSVDCGRAIAAGLTFRPLPVTLQDTLEWDAARPFLPDLKAGLIREQEAQLLREWQDRQS